MTKWPILCCGSLLIISGAGVCLAGVAPTFTLKGVGTVFGKQLAFVETVSKREPSEITLGEEERDSLLDIEILKIDGQAGRVRIKSAGGTEDLVLEAGENTAGTVQRAAGESVAPPQNGGVEFRLREAGRENVFALYQQLAQRSLLRAGDLPRFRITLSTKGVVTASDAVKAIEKGLAEQGILVRPDGEKFATAATKEQDAETVMQVRELSRKLTGNSSQPRAQAEGKSPQPRSQAEEQIPAGMLKLFGAPLGQVLMVYADFVDRPLIEYPGLPWTTMTFLGVTPLSRAEAVYALTASLALNGVTVQPMGDKFLLVMPTAKANRAATLSVRHSVPVRSADTKLVAAGTTRISGAQLPQVVKIYEGLAGRPVEIGSNVPPVTITFESQTPLTCGEVLQALDLLLDCHGLTMVEQPGTRTLKLVPAAESNAKRR